jgi:hypothetical protein
MTTEQLAGEFDRETKTTRTFLERLPPDQLDWRPHPKSFTARGLGSHVIDCIRWVEPIFAGDELDFDPATYRPFQAASLDDVLTGFDHIVVAASAALARTDSAALVAPWRLKIRGDDRKHLGSISGVSG